MTILFKLVPVGAPLAVPTIELGTDTGGRYYVKVENAEVSRCDWFDGLEVALLRAAGHVVPEVNYYGAYRDPQPIPNGVGSGGTGARWQDAISGSSYRHATVSYDGTERPYDEMPETSNVWRERGV